MNTHFLKYLIDINDIEKEIIKNLEEELSKFKYKVIYKEKYFDIILEGSFKDWIDIFMNLNKLYKDNQKELLRILNVINPCIGG
jgi:hypothetical protein